MREVFIFGTCRLCYPVHDNILFIKELRQYHSRHYKVNNINIYTQPVNYTTKLIDILDSILYMKGKLYNNLNPHKKKMLQSILFRGHKTINDLIRPNTHPSLTNIPIKFNNSTKIIFEAFSRKQYIINTLKYGHHFYKKNLPWKINTGDEHNDIVYNKDDFIIKTLNKKECFNILNKIKNEICGDMLVIGPYVSRKVPDFVNNNRINTQNILKEYCKQYNVSYFDMSKIIELNDIEIDETHFNEKGNKILSYVMYNFIII